jgi:hypothetical protein
MAVACVKKTVSQRQAVAVMSMRQFSVTKPSLQSWKQGVTVLGKLAAKAPEAFLEQYPGLMTPRKLLYLASIRGALSPLAKHAR